MSSSTCRAPEFDFAELPAWALVAFAARCARRLQPICTEIVPDCPLNVLSGYEEYVVAIEEAAASARPPEQWPPSEAATDWNRRPDSLADVSVVLAHACGILHFVGAWLDSTASLSEVARNREDAYSLARDFIRDCQLAAACSREEQKILAGINSDFEVLKQKAFLENWTDETAVPPSVFDDN